MRYFDPLFIGKIGQVPTESLSTIDIIRRKTRNSQIVFGSVLIIAAMDYTQSLPFFGRTLLLSSLIITCCTMVKLSTSVKCAGDDSYKRLQELLRMHNSQ